MPLKSNLSILALRIDKLSSGDEDKELDNMYLVKSNAVFPPDKLPKFRHIAPGLDVDYRPMKRSEFRAILAAIDGTSRTAKTLPPDWSKVPEYMRPS